MAYIIEGLGAASTLTNVIAYNSPGKFDWTKFKGDLRAVAKYIANANIVKTKDKAAYTGYVDKAIYYLEQMTAQPESMQSIDKMAYGATIDANLYGTKQPNTKYSPSEFLKDMLSILKSKGTDAYGIMINAISQMIMKLDNPMQVQAKPPILVDTPPQLQPPPSGEANPPTIAQETPAKYVAPFFTWKRVAIVGGGAAVLLALYLIFRKRG